MSNPVIDVKEGLKELQAVAEAIGIDIDLLPVDVLVGALIFSSEHTRPYQFGQIKQVLLSIELPGPIPWGPVIESGYTHAVIERIAES